MGKKRKPRTLGVLLEAFVGMEVVLELKTDAQVLGYVEWADGGMNTSMVRVQITRPNGTRVTLDRIFIRGKRIRYVHIPDSVNVATTLTNHLAVLDKAANKYKRGVRKGSGRRMDKARP